MATDLITHAHRLIYFEEMAASNKLIEHSNGVDGTGKDARRFFHSDITDFVTQSVNNLPADNDKCWMWLIDPQRNITGGKEEFQIMFFIMNAVPIGKSQIEAEAKERVDQCVNQCIAKMIYDSQNNHPIWSRSLDSANNIRTTSYSIQESSRHVGIQISIRSVQQWNKCFNPNDWNL